MVGAGTLTSLTRNADTPPRPTNPRTRGVRFGNGEAERFRFTTDVEDHVPMRRERRLGPAHEVERGDNGPLCRANGSVRRQRLVAEF